MNRDGLAGQSLGSDVLRTPHALEELAHRHLRLLRQLCSGVGDVVGNLGHEMAPSANREVGEGGLQTAKLVVDQGIDLVAGHREPPCSSRPSTAWRKRFHCRLNMASAERPFPVRW